jgi:hypothetical protein
MTLYLYLQSLARTVSKRRPKRIEVFNEQEFDKSSKIYQLYRLALDPSVSSQQAHAELYSGRRVSAHADLTFERLLQRTAERLENLLLLSDPKLISKDEATRANIQAIRWITTGLHLAQHELKDGAVYNLKRGLKSIDTIPAQWQGLCTAALRQMVLHHSMTGSRSSANHYAKQLTEQVAAVAEEASLRARHDVLFADLRRTSLQTVMSEKSWMELDESLTILCQRFSQTWIKTSAFRMRQTVLQVTGQHDRMLLELKTAPLPQSERHLMTAVSSLAVGRISDATKHSLSARTAYREGSPNWLVCTDIAIRGYLMKGIPDRAITLGQELRRYHKMLAHDSVLDARLSLIEEYGKSFQQLISNAPVRRGRPTVQNKRLKTQLNDASIEQHLYISLHVWQLIDMKAQHDDIEYDRILFNMLQFVRRRRSLRNNHRFGIFIEFLYRHRASQPNQRHLQAYKRELRSLGTKYSTGEIIAYEILGEVLTREK